MASSASDQSTLFYLYVDNAWSGPFQLEQIRFFRTHGQINDDTYAYEPDQQRHHTVGELVNATAAQDSLVLPSDLDEHSVPSTTSVFKKPSDATTVGSTATLGGTSLDALPDPLGSFLRSCRELSENLTDHRPRSEAVLDDLAGAIAIQVSAAATDPAALVLLTSDLLRIADYLANRHQATALWDAIDPLRSANPEKDTDDAIVAAHSLVSALVAHAKDGKARRPTEGPMPIADQRATGPLKAIRNVTPAMYDSQPLKAVTDSWDQPHANTARSIMRDARRELRNTEADLEAIHKAYAELQETHARDLTEAREMLASLESSRADEAANAAQSLAEVRALSAEIHRLAEELLGADPDLRGEIKRLADELRGTDASAMAPLAESLLIRLVTRLRNLSKDGGTERVPADLASLREELAKSRGELVQARAQVLLLTDERDRLKRQLDEQRGAADRAISSAKEREQRLRSTVTALEVTKGLHQEVMRELEVQLKGAQHRVGEMENELSSIRGELTHTRTRLADRNQELQDEMRRAVELKAMLEARREELSVNLTDAEAALRHAQDRQAGSGEQADDEMVEALSAKVTHVRGMFEATKRKLDEQEREACRLEEELAASRREALELRGRSDHLTGELDEARSGLASAKKRFDELNRAYARLESERETLQQELTQRKGTESLRSGTDVIAKDTDRAIDKPTDSLRSDGAMPGTTRVNRIVEQLEHRLGEANRRLEQANANLETERHRAQELSTTHHQLQIRVDDLIADRDQLRADLDRLHNEHFANHSRHAAALATATQANIDTERRLREALARAAGLEGQLQRLSERQESGTEALQPLTVEGESSPTGGFVSPQRLAELKQQLREARDTIEKLKLERSSDATPSADAAPGTVRIVAAPQTEARRQALTTRLSHVEQELSSAVSARDQTANQILSVEAERDRLMRELARIKGELESAAVEHRASLKSARDRLGEAQARIQVLEQELVTAKAAPSPDESSNRTIDAARIADLSAERDALATQIKETTARLNKAEVDAELPAIRRQLEQELERIKALTRSLAETQSQADQARRHVSELETRASLAQQERDQLLLESERLKGELAMARAQAGASRDSDQGQRQRVESRLTEVLADRESLLSELARVNADLMQVRGRLARAEAASIVAERLPSEVVRIKEIEAQLAEARSSQATSLGELNALKSTLASVTSERDRLASEVARLQSELATRHGSAEEIKRLKERLERLKQKLTRSHQRLRTLRGERDLALQAFNTERQLRQGSGSSPALVASMSGSRLPFAPDSSGQLSSAAHPTMGGTGALVRNHGLPAALAGLSGNRPAVLVPMIPTASVRRAQPAEITPVQQATITHAARSWSMSPRTLVIAGGLVLAAVAVIAAMQPLPQVRGVVSAPLSSVTAPIAGTWQGIAPQRGQQVMAGQALGVIENLHPDDRRLVDAQQALLQLTALRTTIPEAPVATSVATPADSTVALDALALQPPVDAFAATRAALDQRIAEAAKRVTAEEQALADARTATVIAPTAGLVWSARIGVLSAGTDAVQVVEPTTNSIDLLGDLPIGTRVEIRLGDGRRMTGTVTDGRDLPLGHSRVTLAGELPWSAREQRIEALVLGSDPGLLTSLRAMTTRQFHQ